MHGYSLLYYNSLVLVSHNGYQFDFPMLLAEVERNNLDSSCFERHNVHFSDTLKHLREVC